MAIVKSVMYASGSKESMWDEGERLGLSGEALRMFSHGLDEVTLDLQVDTDTGVVLIIAVDGRVVEGRRL